MLLSWAALHIPLAVILLKLLLVFSVKLDFDVELFKLMSCSDIFSASLNEFCTKYLLLAILL